MRRLDTLRLLGALLLFSLLSIPALPLVSFNAFAQEDAYDDQSDEEYDDNEYEDDADSEYYDDDASDASTEETPFDDIVTINENDIVTLNVLGNDRAVIGWDRSPQLVQISEPTFGQVTMNSDGTITYSPSQVALPAGYEKAETMSYTASADGIPSYTGTVTIRVEQVNDPPIAYSANYTMDENQEAVFELEASDEDGDSLTFEILSSPDFGKGELDPYSGSLTYSPLYEFSGKEIFEFQVSDGISNSEIASIEIAVLEVGGKNSPYIEDDIDEQDYEDEENDDDPPPENTGPVADAGNNFSALAGEPVILDADGSYDTDGDLIEYYWSQISGPAVSLENAETANPGFTAPDVDSETLIVLELSVSDGSELDSASITVTVVPLSIDIIPNSNTNSIKLNKPNSEIPVAIIGSGVLNASANVDEETLRFGPDAASPTRSELSDVNEDGIVDHISYYRTGDLGLESADENACLSGTVETENGATVEFTKCGTVKVT